MVFCSFVTGSHTSHSRAVTKRGRKVVSKTYAVERHLGCPHSIQWIYAFIYLYYPSIAESLLKLFASLTYAHHYLTTLIKYKL